MDYDIDVNIYGNNLLDRTRRNHSSFVKEHVPLPATSFGFDVSLNYNFLKITLMTIPNLDIRYSPVSHKILFIILINDHILI